MEFFLFYPHVSDHNTGNKLETRSIERGRDLMENRVIRHEKYYTYVSDSGGEQHTQTITLPTYRYDHII